MNSIQSILRDLHYEDKDLVLDKKADANVYVYLNKLSNMPIVYFSVAQPQETLKNILLEIWNENDARLYVTIDTEKDREKPAIELYNPRIRPALDNKSIDSFNYAENKDKYDEILVNLRKERVDTGVLWEFIRDRLLKRKEKTVDKDLIKNLTALKGNLQKEIDENIAHILIDRCIFIKFMEDRKFIDGEFLAEFNCDNFVSLLSKNNFGLLNKLFGKANIFLNGDIFKEKIDKFDVRKETIEELYEFFTSDYTTRQLRIFPYKFDIISLPLISNIYESFLEEERQERGIYYTPESVVDLILDETLEKRIKQKLNGNEKPNISVFDPTCGSGIFLVKALKRLIEGHKEYLGKKPSVEYKSEILQKNIYGVDIDEKAVRIAIFSLYLTFLEGEDIKKIRDKIIKQKFKFPILNNKTLFVENSLDDGIFKEKRFDCIVGNPPWGYKFEEKDEKLLRCLRAKFPDCSDKQSSQLFLRKAKDWSKEDTKFGFVVNSSNFYNLQANKFRAKFLESYKLTKYIELSKIKDIIFKTSNQPGVILIFDNKTEEDNKIEYYVPRHNNLSRYLGIILLGDKDRKVVRRKQLLENDDLWKILVNAGLKDWDMVQELLEMPQKLITLAGPGNIQQGLIAYDKYKGHTGEMRKNRRFHATKRIDFSYKKVITSRNIKQYEIIPTNNYIKYGKWLGRPRQIDLFQGNRIFLRRTFDHSILRLKLCFLNYELLCENSVIILKLSQKYDRREIYLLLQAILSSSLAGYFFILVSPKIKKGMFAEITPKVIEKFPVPQIDNKNPNFIDLINLSKETMELKEKNIKQLLTSPDFEHRIKEIEKKIDELVFDIYNLNEPEKQRIKDFYLVNTEREEESKVKKPDMEKYLDRFKEIFEKLLKEKVYLNAEHYITNLLGAAVCFKIEDREKSTAKEHPSENETILQLLTEVITNERIKEYDFTHILGQKKIKIYDKDVFYIIKSNELRDWTLTEAIKDAREEIASYFRISKENGK